MPTSFDDDLSGRTVLVTGASAGIGKEIARNLAGMKAHVIFACRGEAKARAAIAEIGGETGNSKLELMLVDLSRQASIREFAGALAARHPKLDVLVNNAGGWQSTHSVSPDGFEYTWATNVLAYHLLARLLLPSLKAAAKQSGSARIVSVASTMAGKLDFDDLNFEKRKYDGMAVYAQSKQANRMWTWALAETLEGTGVTANAVHPGWINSEFNRNAEGLVGGVISGMTRIFAGTPKQGADTPSWLASSPEVEGRNGRFWIGRKERNCKFRKMDECRRLWERVEEMTASVRAAA